MACEADEVNERLIEALRHRLVDKIKVEQVLDYIDFLQPAQKEQIRQKARAEGNISAAHALLTAVVRARPHGDGWFQGLVDALCHGGSAGAADYLQLTRPGPEQEAEHDNCVRLIHLLAPTLADMNTEQVCVQCVSKELLTDEDKEIVLSETRNKGPRSGARELLNRIVRGQTTWFSDFLQVLLETEHTILYRELTGKSESESDEKLIPMDIEPAGSESAAAEICESPESMVISVAEEPQDESADLYASADPSPSEGPSQPDGNDLAAAAAAAAAAAEAARGTENSEIVLRDYQMEVVTPALEGKNIIICLPTGRGKTRAAVYVTKKHLDGRRAEGKSGKVVVLVNKVPLVEQHYTKEFLPFLKHAYKVERVTGCSPLKISFAQIVRKNDIIICTAQILENFLDMANSGEDEGVNLSDLTLIVIDECHHTQKDGVYKHIMMRYLTRKFKNKRHHKLQKKTEPLPQILGLTASPGVGGATKLDKAVEHILRICANLDASKIMTSLGDFKKEQRKSILPAEDRKQDPFGDVIKRIMNAIHEHAQLSVTCDLGSQNYEQWAVHKERQAAKEGDQTVRVCADYLRRYNDGLLLSNTIRMYDSLSCLTKYHDEQLKKKATPDEEEKINITDTERFLFNLFKDNKDELERLAKNPEFENDSLSKLRTKILQEFSSRDKARGIIFTKTRHSAIMLDQWIKENPKFADISVKSAHLIGGGDQSDVKPMTSAEQKDVLKKFSTGEVNLLVATTVAEEGLDIPACNFVIRYGHVTNEIAMIQSQGRGRADDSTYTVVDVKNSGVAEKEVVNEFREDMMNKAINKIKALKQADYDEQINTFQMQAIMEKKMGEKKQNKKTIRNESPSAVKFSCRNCRKHVCTGEDIHIIENMHRVNVTKEFSKLFNQRENTSLQERLLDYETNGIIACKECGQNWGSMMTYRGIECPCLLVKNFVMDISGKRISNCTKWSELPINFPAFDYIEHATQMADSSDEEETESMNE
ncbi:interferon-induced helicase C domain-containing protein 1 [Cololabis saira]|uniref:interferon-induced helicase C domain-containing protein 1 n=1 Tax=Cololabis saira TaxID=129043 RepID=UPI002AD55FFE|nr:interferon-induced helicase C domain-containing protein 1 [Cololabis saira]